ncbi:MAG: MlaD family protein [Deltaproteobacteria bacterium]
MPEQTPIFKFSPEAKVGIFVLLGVILLVYMSMRLGGFQIGRTEGYTISVSFDSAAGLDKDSSVRVAGVEVGRVKEIGLKGNRAHIMLLIKPDVNIGKDFTAVLNTKGLLGERYIELMPGSPNAPYLKEGDEITRTTSYADMDRLITILSDVASDVKLVSETLGNVFGGPDGEASLRGIINNINEISYRLNRLIEKNDESFGRMVSNLDEFSALLKDQGPGIAYDLKIAIRNLNDELLRTSDNVNRMISDNSGNLKEGIGNLNLVSQRLNETITEINRITKELAPEVSTAVTSVGNIAKKIEKGEGGLGKFLNDPSMYENLNRTVVGINSYIEKAESFRMDVGYRGEYLFDARDVKSYFSLKVQPKADKYYLFEIVDDPRGKIKKETRQTLVESTSSTTVETTTTDAFKFSAQLAKRFKNLVVRGGMIESRAGVGADYSLINDRLRFHLDVFDFSNGNPHVKAGAVLSLNRFFYFTAGHDDAFSEDGLESAYLGIGFQFEDEDLKYLLSSAPNVSF